MTKHLKDYLEAIGDDKDLFIHAIKDGHQVIDYILPCNKTFPEPEEFGIPTEERNKRLLRLDLRGIVFDMDGNLIRLPFNKFFNLGERESTTIENIDLSDPHYICEKLDGSLCAPFEVGCKLIFGSKFGETDFSKKMQEFAEKNNKYVLFSKAMIDIGCTPMFEYIGPGNRIVLDYKEENLVLLAIRKMSTGDYLSYAQIKEYAGWFDIPLVKMYRGQKLTTEFVETLRKQEGVEGVVVVFDDGLRVKIKADHYVQLHKVKSMLSVEKEVVQLILDGKTDDLKPLLLKDDKDKLDAYETELTTLINSQKNRVLSELAFIRDHKLIRKDFALSIAQNLPKWIVTVIFLLWDYSGVESDIRYEIINQIKKNCINNKKYDTMKEDGNLLNGLSNWTGGMFND